MFLPKEYDKIASALEHYNKMKRELQHTTRIEEDVNSEKEWIEKGREEVLKELTKLAAPQHRVLVPC